LYLEDLDYASTNYGIYFAGTSGLARQGIHWNGDTNLYRSAANILKTDDSLIVGDTLTVDGATVNLASGANITVNSANTKRTIVLTAGGGYPTTTIGCSDPTQVEAGTNDIDYWVLDFDNATEERAFWGTVLPLNWSGGTVTATFYWTNAGGGAAETVVWGIKALALGNDDAIDTAYGAEVTVSDTWIAQGDLHISAESAAITIGGTPAAGELVIFNVGRKVASDDLAGDARLLSVRIHYDTSQYEY